MAGSAPKGRRFGAIAGTLGFTMTSRGVGLLRELIISIGFGFSASTDLFYQLSAASVYLYTFMSGPFSTAFVAWGHQSGVPPETGYLPYVARIVARAALLVVVLLWLGASGFAATRNGTRADYVAIAIMAAATLGMVALGLGYAVCNLRGRFVQAQALLFANNASFVALIAAASFTLQGHTKLALTGAYALAALIGLVLTMRALAPVRRFGFAGGERGVAPEVMASLRGRFLPMLGYASTETAGFIATQALVLAMASASGAGVASAASLAQRLCLTTNGLIINPLSNMAMVHLARKPPEAQRAFLLRAVGGVLAGLSVIAVVLVVGRQWLPGLLGGKGHLSHDNALLLVALIPGYALWLVAQGTSMMLSRLSFAQNRARLFTTITTTGYAVACLGRFVAWRVAGFPAAIATGALIELVAALLVFAVILRSGRTRPTVAAAG